MAYRKTSKFCKGLKKGDYYIDLCKESIARGEMVLCLGFKNNEKGKEEIWINYNGSSLWGYAEEEKYKLLTKEEIALMKLKQ